MATKQTTATLYPSGYNSTTYKYASVNSSYPLSNPVGKPSSNTTYSQINLTTGSSAETYVFYTFDCSSIPSTATIDSVACSAKGYISQTNSSRINTRQMQLYKGTTTAKGSATTLSTSTTAANMTCGTWTRTELNDINIRLYAKRGTSNTTTNYYLRFYGATLTITYTYELVTYTVTTSINGSGTISPSGNTSVNSGEDFTLEINTNSEDDEVTITDNGTNVTSRLVSASGEDAYTVTQKSGASYGFQQNYDANCQSGWWQSTNKAKASSASVSTVQFTVTQTTTVTLKVICYAESTYDYFLASAMDETLSTSASADSGAAFTTKNSNSTNVQTYTYSNVGAGTHSFDVKYYKDSYTDSNWDSAQFIIELSPSNVSSTKKTYTISNVSANHTIVVTVVSAATNDTNIYIKRNGTWTKATKAYIKVNGAWKEISVAHIKRNGGWT